MWRRRRRRRRAAGLPMAGRATAPGRRSRSRRRRLYISAPPPRVQRPGLATPTACNNVARGSGGSARMKLGDSALPELDAIDRRIIAELQVDGRMTNVELARRAEITAPPCLRRVRRLEEAGIIRGYHADTDAAQLGWEIIFFAIVGLESQKETVLAAFERLVEDWPEVREC